MILQQCVLVKIGLTNIMDQIDKFIKTNQLHILTDTPNSFNYGTTHLYDRDVFSYYEKINFILSLSKQYNERITYIDTDCISV